MSATSDGLNLIFANSENPKKKMKKIEPSETAEIMSSHPRFQH